MRLIFIVLASFYNLRFVSFVGVAGFEPTTPCSQSRCAYAIIYIAKQTIYKAISLHLLPR